MAEPEGGFETRWLMGATSDLFFTPATESPGVLSALWGRRARNRAAVAATPTPPAASVPAKEEVAV